MKYDFTKIGVTPLAKTRSKTKAEKALMLLETKGKCWVDYHYSGLCLQKGKRLTEDTVVAGHIVAHSKGGDACVAMCDKCNNDQGSFSLEEYVLVLEHRIRKLRGELDRTPNLLYTEFL